MIFSFILFNWFISFWSHIIIQSSADSIILSLIRLIYLLFDFWSSIWFELGGVVERSTNLRRRTRKNRISEYFYPSPTNTITSPFQFYKIKWKFTLFFVIVIQRGMSFISQIWCCGRSEMILSMKMWLPSQKPCLPPLQQQLHPLLSFLNLAISPQFPTILLTNLKSL